MQGSQVASCTKMALLIYLANTVNLTEENVSPKH